MNFMNETSKGLKDERGVRIGREIRLTLYEFGRRINQALFGRLKFKKTMKVKTKRTIFIWGMLALPLLQFLVFWVYVNYSSILLAFKNIDYASGGEEYWTLKNFKTVFDMFFGNGGNSKFLGYWANTIRYWLLGTLWSFPHSILLTYIFRKKLIGYKFYRIVLYLPSIICGVVLAGIFESFVSPNGVVGYVLENMFHMANVPSWFQEVEYANSALLVYAFFFGFAGSYILFSGAMANVSDEITEAAYMDGVTMWQEIWYIDIPLMWPTLSMTLVTSVAGIFGSTGAILLFTPNLESTFTFSYYIFDQVRQYQSYYLPSTLGLIFTVIIFPISMLVRKLVDKIYTV